jgi:hypothetical protein
MKRAAYAILAIAAIELAGYTLFATIAPMWEFDFLTNWGLKAKLFYLHGGIDWPFLQHAWYRNIHPDYPPLMPLAFDAFAFVRGGWDDRWIGLFYPAIALAATLFTFQIARGEVDDIRAAIIAVIMCPLLASPRPGLADGWLAVFAFVALLLIRRGNLTPGAIFLGLGAMTKNEGLTFILAAAIALVVARRAKDVVRLWPAVVLALPWMVLCRIHGVHGDLTSGSVIARVAQHIAHPAGLIEAFRGAPIGKPLMWTGILVGVVIAIRAQRFLLTAAVVQLACYFGAYLATPHDLQWHVFWSWERLVSHVTPLLVYAVLIELMPIIRREALPAPPPKTA